MKPSSTANPSWHRIDTVFAISKSRILKAVVGDKYGLAPSLKQRGNSDDETYQAPYVFLHWLHRFYSLDYVSSSN